MTKDVVIEKRIVRITYDVRVNFEAIKIFVEDSVRDYRPYRRAPIGFKSYKIVN